jgi:rhodanese-related sulfurtransferase
MASHEAARRAVKAGYTDVSVMADGIQGWRDAGMRTDPIN